MSKLQMNHNNEGEIFFSGRHPDKRTNAKWVADMNRKFPELEWGLSVKEKKAKRKKAAKKKVVKKTTKRKKK